MPFTLVSQYLISLDEFIAHWTQVNTTLGATPLVLRGGYALATLQSDRTALATAMTGVVTADNLRQAANADRDLKKGALKERIRQFRATVQGQLTNTIYLPQIPTMPNQKDAPDTWIKTLDDMANVWTQINAATIAGFTGPLKLVGGYLAATFATDVAAMKTAFTAVTTTTRNASIARQTRQDLTPTIRQRLKEYRQAVTGAFPAGHALIQSLPALTPPAGSTPDPVTLSGAWNVAASKAKLDWTPSTDPDLDYYSVRYHPGPQYKTVEEQPVTQVAANTTTFLTVFGLVFAGSEAYFKVYVVTKTGNEKGSNAVRVLRV